MPLLHDTYHPVLRLHAFVAPDHESVGGEHRDHRLEQVRERVRFGRVAGLERDRLICAVLAADPVAPQRSDVGRLVLDLPPREATPPDSHGVDTDFHGSGRTCDFIQPTMVGAGRHVSQN